MQIAGIIVHIRAGRTPAVVAALGDMPGVEVHHVADDRLVATVESATVHEGVDRVSAIEALPDVLATNLVEHRVLDGPAERPADDPVPAFLRD